MGSDSGLTAQSGWEAARQGRPRRLCSVTLRHATPENVSQRETGTTGMTWDAAMRRAMELAHNGPATGVNPRVGCVIVDEDGRFIAEGWHRGVGTPHAEVDALGKLPDGGARGATAVVTLEPCNHTGHTGPCSEALIAAG